MGWFDVLPRLFVAYRSCRRGVALPENLSRPPALSAIMVGMGLISRGLDRLFDRLPGWVQFVVAILFLALAIPWSLHEMDREGFFHFVLRVIFSPEI